MAVSGTGVGGGDKKGCPEDRCCRSRQYNLCLVLKNSLNESTKDFNCRCVRIVKALLPFLTLNHLMRKKLSAFINIMVRYAFDNDWGAAKRILENVAHPDVNKLQLVSPWLFENYQKMFRFDKKFEMSGYRRVIPYVVDQVLTNFLNHIKMNHFRYMR